MTKRLSNNLLAPALSTRSAGRPSRFRSKISQAVHRTATDFHEAGVLGKRTMREFDATCLTPLRQFEGRKIEQLRQREQASQAVFALAFRCLDESRLAMGTWREKAAGGFAEDVGLGGEQRTRLGRVTGNGRVLGLIAGNGRFPFLLLEAARAQGLRVVVAALNEETDPEMDRRAARESEFVRVHWLSLGELSKLIETFQAARA